MPKKNSDNELKDVLKGLLVSMKEVIEILESIDEALGTLKTISGVVEEIYSKIDEHIDYTIKNNSEIKAMLDQIDNDLVSFRKMVWVEYNNRSKHNKYGYKSKRHYNKYRK